MRNKRDSPESLQIKQWQDMTQAMKVELCPNRSQQCPRGREQREECLKGITTEVSTFLEFPVQDKDVGDYLGSLSRAREFREISEV